MIISVSRRTDIPAYYSDWFFSRLKDSCVLVRNPMSFHQVSQVSLKPEDVDCFVFWTKNPLPMLEKLPLLDGFPYMFQFTLTPYDKDVEPYLPEKSVLAGVFCRLASQVGPERLVWRYDPILISDKYSLAFHIDQFNILAKRLQGATSHCVISFLDYYPAIKKGLSSLNARTPNHEEKLELAASFSASAKEAGISLASCAEAIDLKEFSVSHSSCIDPQMIARITGCSVNCVKDKSQRPECGCIESVDIGAYSTCQSRCLYCYANSGTGRLAARKQAYDPGSPILCSQITKEDRITIRQNRSLLERQTSFLL